MADATTESKGAASKAAGPAAAKGNAAGPAKDQFADAITSPVPATWAFLKSGFLSLYLPLLKLNLLRTIAYYLALALMLGIVTGLSIVFGLGAIESSLLFIVLFALIIIFGGALILWMVQTFESAAFLLVASKVDKGPYTLSGALKEASSPTLRFTVLDVGLRIVLFLPLLILGVAGIWYLQSNGMLGAGLLASWYSILAAPAILAVVLYLFFVYLLYDFLVQFWRYGFLLERKGVVQSLKRGLRLIRQRPAQVLLFDILYVLAFIMASIPSYVYGLVMYFVMMFVQGAAVVALGPLGWIVYMLINIAVALLALVFSTLAGTICRPLHYLFWKRISQTR